MKCILYFPFILSCRITTLLVFRRQIYVVFITVLREIFRANCRLGYYLPSLLKAQDTYYLSMYA